MENKINKIKQGQTENARDRGRGRKKKYWNDFIHKENADISPENTKKFILRP